MGNKGVEIGGKLRKFEWDAAAECYWWSHNGMKFGYSDEKNTYSCHTCKTQAKHFRIFTVGNTIDSKPKNNQPVDNSLPMWFVLYDMDMGDMTTTSGTSATVSSTMTASATSSRSTVSKDGQIVAKYVVMVANKEHYCYCFASGCMDKAIKLQHWGMDIKPVLKSIENDANKFGRLGRTKPTSSNNQEEKKDTKSSKKKK